MDKRQYEVEIAGVEMAILSDEREEFVMRLVRDLDEKIRQITSASRNCSKMDAALLVALDVSSEKTKAEKRIRNLEAQIGLYDANLRRLREENVKLREAMLSGKLADVPSAEVTSEEAPEDASAENAAAENAAAEEAPASESSDGDVPAEPAKAENAEENVPEQLDLTSAMSEPAPAAAVPEAAPAARSDKLRQIESLLRGK